jgi:ATP-binding cassette, subfamily F, member 3
MDRLSSPVTTTHRAKLVIPPPPKVLPALIKLRNATIGYTADSPLVKNVDFTLTRGSRLVLLGPNGAGKTTVMRALTGQLPLLTGTREEGEGLSMGVFTQDLAQDLPQDEVALKYVLDSVRPRDMTISDQTARAALGALGLTGEKALRQIGQLSGGEKARVALAVFVLIPHNLLVLDEPSNHLDMATVEVLTDALAEYKGTLLVISHNRPFVERLRPTQVGIVSQGKLVVEERLLRPGDWEYDPHSRSKSNAAPAAGVGKASAGAGGSGERAAGADAGAGNKMSYAAQRALFKRFSAAPKRIAKIQELIEALEAKISDLEDGMFKAGADAGKVRGLSLFGNRIAKPARDSL